MRRRMLAMTMGLGLVVTAMGFSGIYAVFTDRATTGTNSAESGSQGRIADLKIATTSSGDCIDGSFTDDLATGIITVADVQPGDGSSFTTACLRNDGSAELDLAITAIDLVDTETGCTGDEAASGDETCGTAGIGDGELAAALVVAISRLDCQAQTSDLVATATLPSLAASPVSLQTLAPGETACIPLRVQMLVSGQAGFTLEDIQKAQSDKVEWRFAFDGTAS